ncbi:MULTISPECIES: type IV pilus modification PilV family protein [Desulfococcus]|jgi:type IV pilus assembly protein PilV|uniref:Type IV pilus modification protein PilV n=1 Tax=Desulfococcus multivorans DSM 2059 TaxID=1121405 RepID=S7TX81_DESML|nr:prepilin-type N-terminal cleavage/methylation domain-containing protein [Desulfococcus multivorans]AOY58045.1 conserved uncharacterized protein [Desulfococcus multivorans]AQV00407.1 prepilin-type cleavage/methylation domain-containing protein [Desulfococcus multivorans]EPR41385.1 hypothetical protein dsmv_2166 [Desulfococcus multivorans DSM 2059]SJZ71070.1 general secretion pathway protein I [Desulfococcus multivorans DSM 2059]
MKPFKTIGGEGGFTLLEILFAVVILSAGLLGVAAMQVTAIHGNGYGMKLTEATDRIVTRMEAVKKMPYPSIQSEDEETDAEGFTRRTIVQTDTPLSGVKTVEVEVSWNDRQGTQNHRFSFHTIIME